MFQNKIVVITGFAQGLGLCMREEFEGQGATVCGIDILPNDYFIGDIGDKTVLDSFAKKVVDDFGRVDILINNAKPRMHGISNCSYEEFQYAMQVGVTAPFYLAQQFAPYMGEGSSILNISSARAHMSQPEGESYGAAKGGISALTHAMAMSLAGKIRVNAISPGWIDTTGEKFPHSDHIQQPVGRIGNPLDIANLALYLCSDKAGFITGQDFSVDGGMNKNMIYHGEFGWKLER